MTKISDIIKARREEVRITQQELADFSGVSLRTIKSIELDKGNPSVKTLEKIIDILGMEISLNVKGLDI